MKFRKKYFLHFLWIVPLGFLIYLFLQFEWMFGENRYQENTFFFIENSEKIFEEQTKLKLPNGSHLIQGSELKFGPNFITNLFFKVPNIESFTHSALPEYSFDIGSLKYPNLDGAKIQDKEYNIFLVPFCKEEEYYQGTIFQETMDRTLLRDFCDENEAMISQIYRDTETGKILTIIPSKNIVWFNWSSWF